MFIARFSANVAVQKQGDIAVIKIDMPGAKVR